MAAKENSNKLETDSPLSRRIARSFLQFLHSVEPSRGDSEALDVATDLLAGVFKIDRSSITTTHSTSDSLIDIFSSREAAANHLVVDNGNRDDAPSTSSGNNAQFSQKSPPVPSQDRTREQHSPGGDELVVQFFGALEKIHYFRRMPDGNDDQIQLDRATSSIHNALEEMRKAGCHTFDQKSLAGTFKAQGNRALQSKHYAEAIEFYTFAIAMEDNAIYYCNRAAAYTQIHRYADAVQDCLKSIEMNPNYTKAYSRLGFAYYAQGKYRDAIDKGFMKALELDPNNDSVKENIRAAEQKLKEEQQSSGPGQGSASTSNGQSNHQFSGGSRSNAIPPPPPFTSIPFNINGLPVDINSMLMNMAGNGHNFGNGPEGESETGAQNEAGVRIGGNINLNENELSEELSDALRSMMGMFSGAPRGNQQDDSNGRPAPN